MKNSTVVLKLSGETLASPDKKGCFDEERVNAVADVLLRIQRAGVRLAVVFGGGNIWRGRFSDQMNPAEADQMGMLATVMNALAVAEALSRKGAKRAVFTAQEMNRFAKLYTREAALSAMDDGAIALLAGGTGNPYFTTDTLTALRALELDADLVLKGTKPDGVYTADPEKDKNAEFIPSLSFASAVERRLGVLDITAFELCRKKQSLTMRIFSMSDLDNIYRAATGEAVGTLLYNE